jgi:probable F420-dependent oxidoreductase
MAARFAIGVPNVGPFADARWLGDLAGRAEAAGWDGFFVWDHLLYHEPGWPVVDPWVAITCAATATSRVRLGVLMAVLPRYRPLRLAKTVATLDQLTGGRMVFGAGLGSVTAEYSAFGEDPSLRTRATRLEESLQVMNKAWRAEPVSHQGGHLQLDAPVMRPQPVQRPRVPVWIGGRWPARRPFIRAAEWDGVMPTHEDFPHGTTMPADQLGEIVDFVRNTRSRTDPFAVAMEGQSDDDPDSASEQVAAYLETGLTWWVEKLGWWRGDLARNLGRVDAGPPRASP